MEIVGDCVEFTHGNIWTEEIHNQPALQFYKLFEKTANEFAITLSVDGIQWNVKLKKTVHEDDHFEGKVEKKNIDWKHSKEF